MYKLSYYNTLIPVPEENEYLLYNSLSGGLEVLPWVIGEILNEQQSNESFSFDFFPEHIDSFKYLLEREYLVEATVDEKQAFYTTYTESIDKRINRKEGEISLTIGTTIMCNMGCPYCFEFNKPNKLLRDPENINSIIFYIEDMIAKAPVERFHNMAVTWYGGEPLINKQAIEELTPRLLALCEKHSMTYYSNIITNGLLLTQENWRLLEKHSVYQAQVTIDGNKDTHEKYRPLKGKSGNNYFKILENLSHLPESIHLTIRINTDKEVAKVIPELMSDLQVFGIWPQKRNTVNISVAWLRVYDEAQETETAERFTAEEFFDYEIEFRLLKMNIFNRWAKENNLRYAKLQWKLPAFASECGTWVSPYSFVIDPEANVHKCWETIHDKDQGVKNASKGFNLEDLKPYTSYDRFKLDNNECATCKALPICDSLSCSHEALKKGKPTCTPWKTKLGESLKNQYTFMKNNPDKMIAPFSNDSVNSGHSNK